MNSLLKSSLVVGALAGIWIACDKPKTNPTATTTTTPPSPKTPVALTVTAGTVKLSPSKDSINPMKDLGTKTNDSIKALSGAGDSLKFESNLLTVKNLDTIQTKFAAVFTLTSEVGANVTVTAPTDKKLKFALVQRETASKTVLLDSTSTASAATPVPADGNLFLVVQSLSGVRNGGTDSLKANTEYTFTVKADPKSADAATKEAATLMLKVKWTPTATVTTTN